MVISKDELNTLPVEVFRGEIILVDSPLHIDFACSVLSQSDVIGFDTETKPAFKKGTINKVALLQLSTEDKCFLFRLNKIDIPPCILDILSNEQIKKIGLSISNDFLVLKRNGSFTPKGFIDLQNIVSQYGIEDKSLQKIYAILFKHRITKGQRLTNWEADQLSEAQKMYAAIDAWACQRIYRELLKHTPKE